MGSPLIGAPQQDPIDIIDELIARHAGQFPRTPPFIGSQPAPAPQPSTTAPGRIGAPALAPPATHQPSMIGAAPPAVPADPALEAANKQFGDWQASEPKAPVRADIKTPLWRKLLGVGEAGLVGYTSRDPQAGMQIGRGIIDKPFNTAEDAYKQQEADWEKQGNLIGAARKEADTQGLNRATEAQRYAQAQKDATPPAAKPVTDDWRPVAGTNLETNARTGESRPIQGMQPLNKQGKAESVMIDGRPGYAVQDAKSPTGWSDVTGKPISGRVEPPPSFAQTGLYDPVEVTTPGGGMQPGAFDRRTGKVSPIRSGGGAVIPPAAQKEINTDLATARNIDRLDGAQKKILSEVEKRGQKGPAGGGPYLNGPESMQFVSNHIAMTFGAVKGARVGRDLIEAHIKARDLDQATEAAAQRVLSGGVITYSQAQQMMATASINRSTAWNQAAQAAQQYGVPDAVKLPDDLQQGAGDTGGGFKVNDTIMQNGVTFKVTKVDKNGKPLAASPAPNH